MDPATASTSESSFSIETWCKEQIPSDWTKLPIRSIDFLQRLNLSSIHPFCDPSNSHLYNSRRYDIVETSDDGTLTSIPPQGPLLDRYGHFDSIYETIITLTTMAVPSVWAMIELWLRLFALIIAPAGITYLLYREMSTTTSSTTRKSVTTKTGKSKTNDTNDSPRSSRMLALVCFLTTASGGVLLTDTLYILEFGPKLGVTLLSISLLLSFKVGYQNHSKTIIIAQLVLLFIVVYLINGFQYIFNSSGNSSSSNTITFGNPLEQVTIDEGLYYDKSNRYISELINTHWPEQYRRYDDQTDATPWMVTGDTRTGLPFLLNTVPKPKLLRVWVQMPHDMEVIALDIKFPSTGHDNTKPIYLLFHGLNGGSDEEYVRDFIWRRNTYESSTVIVMVARGLMDLPIRGWNTFHGARWEDGHVASTVIKAAMPSTQLLAGVGYSMGAIILGNMVARTGTECALDVAVSISGGLDLRYQITNYRAQRLWQPILTAELRDTFVLGKWGERVKARLTKQQMKQLMQSIHITEIDETAVVAYNGFKDIVHYYSEMSVLGDIPYNSDAYNADSIPSSKRIHNISIPFCVIHALDDPLITWRTVASNNGLMNPTLLTQTGVGRLVLLLTKRGGHVGWPLGWWPQRNTWKWMNDAAMSFAVAVEETKKRHVEK